MKKLFIQTDGDHATVIANYLSDSKYEMMFFKEYEEKMKTRTVTRTYPAICTSCTGVGQMNNPSFNPNVTEDLLVIDCPVCLGAQTIIITETFEEEISEVES